MKILVSGAKGMLARAVAEYCRSAGDDVLALDRAALDITDRTACETVIAAARPDAIINCAAYTDVDGAERDEAAAYAANSDGPANLAAAAKANASRFITISTDYVFDGENTGFYTEDDAPNPLGVYARSKFDGELRTREENADALIVRSGWIYGRGGTNFLSVIPELLRAGKHITAISDSFGTPTFAGDLAKRLRELAAVGAKGVVHVTNAGEGSTYYGVACETARLLGIDASAVTPISDADLSRPAPRPHSSRLATKRLAELGLDELPDWRDALERFVRA
ncbi:MAG: dTDP-4-dehydrorhamnose reductase [Acidobacteria bacterium]|nr:dTDP-4-dehydrorhamnose reductase [Acidobacteriota bacterium]